jgi:hypothetical protein
VDARQTILVELRISRKAIYAGDEVVPRFVIYSPEYIYVMKASLPDDDAERRERFRLIRLFMVWKSAVRFTFATELFTQNCLSIVLVSRDQVMGALQCFTREPLSICDPVFFGSEGVDDEIVNLLPQKVLKLSKEDFATIERFEDGDAPGITWFRSE